MLERWALLLAEDTRNGNQWRECCRSVYRACARLKCVMGKNIKKQNGVPCRFFFLVLVFCINLLKCCCVGTKHDPSAVYIFRFIYDASLFVCTPYVVRHMTIHFLYIEITATSDQLSTHISRIYRLYLRRKCHKVKIKLNAEVNKRRPTHWRKFDDGAG